MVNEKRIAIIPARGGSKRIPKKNIIDFQGKPLIYWTIKAAQDTNLFDRILVSTDDKEIADISRNYGAEAPFLRENISDDFTPVSIDTIKSLKQAESYWNEKYDSITQLMANCPLRDHLLITEFLEYFDKNEFNFLLSSVQFRSMNPFWAFTKNENGKFQYLFPDYLEKRSQDIEKSFCPTGSIWIAKHDSLLKMNTFHGLDCTYKEIDWISAIDIDDYEDLELANVAAARKLQNKI
tara:strand:- start:298 stop:1008 length:711 start_codon:yes stop_codon:yes gene_type:complete